MRWYEKNAWYMYFKNFASVFYRQTRKLIFIIILYNKILKYERQHHSRNMIIDINERHF